LTVCHFAGHLLFTTIFEVWTRHSVSAFGFISLLGRNLSLSNSAVSHYWCYSINY
jgi:hypothetical protein